MGFDALLRDGIGIANSETKSLQVIKKLGIRHWAGQDSFGKVTYTPASPAAPRYYDAIIDIRDEQKIIGGVTVNVKAEIIILEPVAPSGAPGTVKRNEPIDPRDIVILPDGSTGPIIGNPGILDPTTLRPYFIELTLGRP